MQSIADFRKLTHADEQLSLVPRIWEADIETEPDLRGVFIEGAPWKGRETRIFAWVGLPEGASPEHKVPGVVLIHGGGGTAFADWVRVWTAQGYAAIAMDTCGGMPCWAVNPHSRTCWARHSHSGPNGWLNLADSALPPEDQWPYHAISSVIRAGSYFLSLPEVDASRVSLTGISWGGVLTLLVSALDHRYRCAVPVYGSGYLAEAENSLTAAVTPDDPRLKRWMDLWDPKNCLPAITMPTLFLTDAEDMAFPIPVWQRSTDQVSGTVRRSMRIRFPHGHQPCWPSRTIPDFMKACYEGTPLPQLEAPALQDGVLSCGVDLATRRMLSAQLCFTRACGYWADATWGDYPVELKDHRLSYRLPPFTKAAFFSLKDDHGATWSSPVWFKG